MRLRPPTRDDAEAIHAVCVARDIADIGHPDFTLADILADWEMPGMDMELDCFVVEDGAGTIVGYAGIDQRGAMVVVHPAVEGRGVGTLLRDAIEARARKRGQPDRQMIAAANRSASEHLSAAGYHRTTIFMRMRIADLATAPPAPAEPAVRRYDLDAEGAAVNKLGEDALDELGGNVRFDDEQFATYVRVKCPPELRLAVDDEEGLAGVLTGEAWTEEGIGYVGILGVAPRARGRGYGRALLLAAFAAFRDLALTSGELSVHGTNAPATRLYESVGMTEAWRSERWERP